MRETKATIEIKAIIEKKSIMKIKTALVVALSSLFVNSQVLANQSSSITLTLEDVLKTTQTHHPKVSAVLAKQKQAASKRLAAEGAFDWQWQQQLHTRPTGYYDGWIGEQKASRQLSFANAKVSMGYRLSDGNFPVYEAEWETLSGGELNLGAQMSLWRNRDINSVSLKQITAEQNEKITQLDRVITVNDLLRIASHYYLDWYFAHHQLKISQERLQLAETREKALAEQVAQGNLAQMELNDFERERLKRRVDVIKSQQSLDKATWSLALYYRNERGEPQAPLTVAPPKTLKNLKGFNGYFSEKWIDKVVMNHPDIKQLKTKQNLQRSHLAFAKNQALPELDMSFKVARDIGNGSNTLDGNESIISLNFKMPLEKRLITGNINTEKARINELRWQQKNREEQISSQLMGLIQRLQQSQILVTITDEQTQLAKRLVEQENQRFIAGDGTQFLLNSRESDYAKAQLDELSAKVSQRRLVIDLLAVAGEMTPAPWSGL